MHHAVDHLSSHLSELHTHHAVEPLPGLSPHLQVPALLPQVPAAGVGLQQRL
jgi:hypothetical protein